jgi:hypothetical protein
MAKKTKKNLFLYEWIIELLDREGEKYDGLGTVVAAAIAAFCSLSKSEKIAAFKKYREKEIKMAYNNEDDDGTESNK